MLKLKNWHYLNYKGYFYLCVQWKTNEFLEVYGRFLEVSGGFAELQHVTAERPAMRIVSVLSADMF